MLKVKWEKVLNYLDLDERPLLLWINLGNGTMFRITAFFIHGGFHYPRMGFLVGIERVGCFFFTLENIKTKEYIMEKLNLPESDAGIMADWINSQLGHDAPQQGEYNEGYIKEVVPYGNIGERFLMPLSPEIIE